jgi:catechol 2,3-dioxygenase-like lactoylglutathione lyase family enzyme
MTRRMQVGRLVDHIHLVVSDLDKSKRFYKAIFEVLGIEVSREGDEFMQADEFYMSRPRPEGGPVSHIHLAFQAKDQATVAAVYKAALAVGGTDNGAPGLRRYHPRYYAAFVLDPDGNNIEAVHHGPATRSAASITVEPEP